MRKTNENPSFHLFCLLTHFSSISYLFLLRANVFCLVLWLLPFLVLGLLLLFLLLDTNLVLLYILGFVHHFLLLYVYANYFYNLVQMLRLLGTYYLFLLVDLGMRFL